MTDSGSNILQLADTVSGILEKGFVLNESALHFIYSTWGIHSPRELMSIMEDDTTGDAEMICSLAIAPDEQLQLLIEPYLGQYHYTENDLLALQAMVSDTVTETAIRFPDDSQRVPVTVNADTLNRFIRQLNIAKQIPDTLIHTICTAIPAETGLIIRVRLRNAPLIFNDLISDFFSSLFQSRLGLRPDLPEITDFAISQADAVSQKKDVMTALLDRRLQLLKYLDQIHQTTELLKKSTMESLMLQGVRVPSTSPETIRKQLSLVELILFEMFGWMELAGSKTEHVDHGNFSGNDDMEKIFRLLS